MTNAARTHRVRTAFTVLAAASLAALFVAQPASAGKTKTSWYMLVADAPNVDVAWSPQTTVNFYLTNCGQSVSQPTASGCSTSSGPTITTADLVLPLDWSASSASTDASGAAVAVNGRVITITGLKLGAGASLHVSATLRPGLTNVNTILSVTAGIPSATTPTYQNATPNPTVRFPVHFRFTGQPQDGVKSGSPSGALCPVRVQVKDSGDVDVPLGSVTVALTKAPGTNLDPGISATATTDSTGLASFASCPAAAAGGPYSIVASSTSPSISTPIASSLFTVYDKLTSCGGPCSLDPSIGKGGTQVKVNSTTNGNLAEAALDATAPTFTTFACRTNTDPLLLKTNQRPDVLQAVSSTIDAKTVTVTWSKSVTHDFTDTGTPHWEVCMRAPISFITDAGSPPADSTGDPDGWFVGLLPVCGAAGIGPTDPCVTLSRTSQSQEVAVITFPQNWAGDPYVH